MLQYTFLFILKHVNNLYNDKNFKQITNENEKGSIPELYITNDTNTLLKEIEQQNPKILELFIFNKARFEKIGAVNIHLLI